MSATWIDTLLHNLPPEIAQLFADASVLSTLVALVRSRCRKSGRTRSGVVLEVINELLAPGSSIRTLLDDAVMSAKQRGLGGGVASSRRRPCPSSESYFIDAEMLSDLDTNTDRGSVAVASSGTSYDWEGGERCERCAESQEASQCESEAGTSCAAFASDESAGADLHASPAAASDFGAGDCLGDDEEAEVAEGRVAEAATSGHADAATPEASDAGQDSACSVSVAAAEPGETNLGVDGNSPASPALPGASINAMSLSPAVAQLPPPAQHSPTADGAVTDDGAPDGSEGGADPVGSDLDNDGVSGDECMSAHPEDGNGSDVNSDGDFGDGGGFAGLVMPEGLRTPGGNVGSSPRSRRSAGREGTPGSPVRRVGFCNDDGSTGGGGGGGSGCGGGGDEDDNGTARSGGDDRSISSMSTMTTADSHRRFTGASTGASSLSLGPSSGPSSGQASGGAPSLRRVGSADGGDGTADGGGGNDAVSAICTDAAAKRGSGSGCSCGSGDRCGGDSCGGSGEGDNGGGDDGGDGNDDGNAVLGEGTDEGGATEGDGASEAPLTGGSREVLSGGTDGEGSGDGLGREGLVRGRGHDARGSSDTLTTLTTANDNDPTDAARGDEAYGQDGNDGNDGNDDDTFANSTLDTTPSMRSDHVAATAHPPGAAPPPYQPPLETIPARSAVPTGPLVESASEQSGSWADPPNAPPDNPPDAAVGNTAATPVEDTSEDTAEGASEPCDGDGGPATAESGAAGGDTGSGDSSGYSDDDDDFEVDDDDDVNDDEEGDEGWDKLPTPGVTFATGVRLVKMYFYDKEDRTRDFQFTQEKEANDVRHSTTFFSG